MEGKEVIEMIALSLRMIPEALADLTAQIIQTASTLTETTKRTGSTNLKKTEVTLIDRDNYLDDIQEKENDGYEDETYSRLSDDEINLAVDPEELTKNVFVENDVNSLAKISENDVVVKIDGARMLPDRANFSQIKCFVLSETGDKIAGPAKAIVEYGKDFLYPNYNLTMEISNQELKKAKNCYLLVLAYTLEFPVVLEEAVEGVLFAFSLFRLTEATSDLGPQLRNGAFQLPFFNSHQHREDFKDLVLAAE